MLVKLTKVKISCTNVIKAKKEKNIFTSLCLQRNQISKWKMIHYLENKVGVVNFVNAQGLAGPWALKFYQSAGFCKIYYSQFIFEVITFLSKFQNHSKKLSNYGSISKIWRKNHYLEKLNSKIQRKNHYLEFLKSTIWRKHHSWAKFKIILLCDKISR